MKPAHDKSDYTSCAQVCFVHHVFCCGTCELIQLANAADLRHTAGHPVATPIANPMLMQQMQQMQQMQMNQIMMNQAGLMNQMGQQSAAPASAPQ